MNVPLRVLHHGIKELPYAELRLNAARLLKVFVQLVKPVLGRLSVLDLIATRNVSLFTGNRPHSVILNSHPIWIFFQLKGKRFSLCRNAAYATPGILNSALKGVRLKKHASPFPHDEALKATALLSFRDYPLHGEV